MSGDAITRLHNCGERAEARTQKQAELAAKSVQLEALRKGNSANEAAALKIVRRLAAEALADNRKSNVHAACDQKNLVVKLK